MHNNILYSGWLAPFNRGYNYRESGHQRIANALKDAKNVKIAVQLNKHDWYHSGDFGQNLGEERYFEIMRTSRFTLVPPNYTGITISVKRATDAIANGSVPVFYDTKLAGMLGDQWMHAIVCEPEQLLDRCNPDKSNEIIENLRRSMDAIDIKQWLQDYIDNWSTFKHEYLKNYLQHIR